MISQRAVAAAVAGLAEFCRPYDVYLDAWDLAQFAMAWREERPYRHGKAEMWYTQIGWIVIPEKVKPWKIAVVLDHQGKVNRALTKKLNRHIYPRKGRNRWWRDAPG